MAGLANTGSIGEGELRMACGDLNLLFPWKYSSCYILGRCFSRSWPVLILKGQTGWGLREGERLFRTALKEHSLVHVKFLILCRSSFSSLPYPKSDL